MHNKTMNFSEQVLRYLRTYSRYIATLVPEWCGVAVYRMNDADGKRGR